MNPSTNCPHCGAELLTEVPYGEIRYKCGYEYDQDHEVYYRTELCREREARQKAEAELNDLILLILPKESNSDDEGDTIKPTFMPLGWKAEQVRSHIYQSRQLERELTEKTNEVERLRGLLKDHATFLRENGFAYRAEELMRGYAPAPEEPTIKESLQVEPAPKWRELGADEVICEGDERESDFIVGWHPVSCHVGIQAGWYKTVRFRTRRPLPKQEEMPLEKELETLWEHSEHIDSLTGHMAFKALAKSLRYLRDEIQKLKEAR